MTAAPHVLDDAFDRLGRWGFDDPDGYINHGPMVCEALEVLGRPVEVAAWSMQDTGTPPATPVEPRGFVWEDALGDGSRAGEWMGYFERAVADDGWRAVLGEWLPRLLPGLEVALFHGAIRSAHATRAIETVDTPARRAELVRALGYWAATWGPGHPPTRADGGEDVGLGVVHAAADAARRYLAKPNIIHLHGVTAAMAVSILVRHVDEAAAVAALAQLEADNTALYDNVEPVAVVPAARVDADVLVEAAITSGDAHAVKLVEACRRGTIATGDPIFHAAAERVTRRGLRSLEQQHRITPSVRAEHS